MCFLSSLILASRLYIINLLLHNLIMSFWRGSKKGKDESGMHWKEGEACGKGKQVPISHKNQDHSSSFSTRSSKLALSSFFQEWRVDACEGSRGRNEGRRA